MKKAFDAKEDFRVPNPDGTIDHAEVRIGDSVLLMFDSNDNWPDTPAFLRIYFQDADASFRRAIEAGAESITKVMDSFLGERGRRVKDPFGNIWWIVTRVEDLIYEEKWRRAGKQKYLDNMAIAIKHLMKKCAAGRSKTGGLFLIDKRSENNVY
jgi:PhnB protein